MVYRLCIFWVMILFMVTPAYAESFGGYASVKFIDSYQTHWGGGILSNSHSQNTIGGAFALGYDFYMNSDAPIRAEVEYAIRTDFNDESTFNFGNVAWNSDVKYNVQTLLMNVYYDFYNETNFTPYISGGAGAAFVSGRVAFLQGNDDITRSLDGTVFAWTVGGGVGYLLSDTVTADLGYRYLSLGTSSAEVRGNEVDVTGSAHEFSLGLRFGF